MRRSSAGAIALALAAALAGCAAPPEGAPRVDAVEPAVGYASAPVAVVIRGDGFYAEPTETASGERSVALRQRAWLGGVELSDVRRVDVRTLSAVVPAGIAAGAADLVVENARGERATARAAYRALPGRPPALSAELHIGPATASLGQAVTLTLAVRNGGEAPATGVAPALAAPWCDAAAPAPQDVAPAAAATFTWTCRAGALGHVTASAAAAGRDPNTGEVVSAPSAGAACLVVNPGALTAALSVERARASVGQVVAATLTVANTGDAAVLGVTPTLAASGAGSAAISAPAAQDLPGGATASFRFALTAAGAGDVALAAQVAGTDEHSGAGIAASAGGTLAVDAPASLSLSASAAPAQVSVGQPFTVAAVATNAGGAAATVAPAIALPAGVTAVASPSVAAQTLAGGASVTFTWVVAATAPGTLAAPVRVEGADANSGAPLSAAATASGVRVQAPAALAAALVTPLPPRMSVGQAAPLTLRITNTGEAAAALSGASPGLAGAALAASPTAPLPPSLAGGASVDLAWTVTAVARGTAAVAPAVTAADGNSGAPASAAAPASSVSVQAPAALTASWLTPPPARASVGQAFPLAIRVANGGEAAASLTSADPRLATALQATAAPLLPPSLAGGASVDLAWTVRAVSATAPATAAVAPAVAGADANSAVALSAAVSARAIAVDLPAALVATAAATPGPLSVGQPIAVALTVTNTGGADAVVSPALAPPVGVVESSAPAPGTTTLAGGGRATFTWTYATTAPGTPSFAPRADGVDADSGAPIAAAATAGPLLVQRPAALAAEVIAAPPAVMSAGQTSSFTVRVTNTGEAGAVLGAPALSFTGGALAIGAAPAAPPRLGAGASADLTWTVRAAAAGRAAPSASIAATDANSGAAVAAAGASAAETLVQVPAALSLTYLSPPPSRLSVGQTASVVVHLANGGEATASISSADVGLGGAALAVAGAPLVPPSLAGGAAVDLTWTLRGAASGTVTLAPAVAAADANSGAAASAALAARTVAVQTPPSLVAVASASPLQVSAGQPITVALTVTNTGEADAAIAPSLLAPAGTREASGPGAATRTLSTGVPATFTWTFATTASGAPTFTPRVDGSDVNSGAAVAASASAGPALVQRPAALAAAVVAAPPARMSVGQTAPFTVRLTNTGEATAALASAAAPLGGGALELAATPSPPAALAGGDAVDLTWTVRAAAAGPATVGASFAGSDANSSDPVAATLTPASVTVETPAKLQATLLAAPPATASVGQSLSLVVRLANVGGATAALGSADAGLGGAGLTVQAAPALPATLAASAFVDLAWTLRASASGAATVTPSVTGSDANSSAALSAAAPTTSSTVQTPASLAVTLAAPAPATVSVGQVFTITARVANGGQATASLAAIDAGLGGPISVVAAPGAPAALAGGATADLAWTLRADGAGAGTLAPSVSGADANSLAALAAALSPAASLRVQAPAALSATWVAAPAPRAGVGQQVTFTVRFTNGGEATALLASASARASGGVAPATEPTWPASLAGGASVDLSWTLDTVSVGPAGVAPSLSGTDANAGTAVSATATAQAFQVQTPASLTGSASAPWAVPVGPSPITVTLHLVNAGQADATATPSLSAGGPVAPVTSPGASLTVPGGGSVDASWTYVATGGGTATFSIGASWSDANGAAGALTVPSRSVKIADAVAISSDPFLDGTPFADLATYGDQLVLGPRQDGAGLVSMAVDGSAVARERLQFAKDVDPNGATSSNSAPAAPPYTSIGYRGCAANTLACGPDDENGRGLFTSARFAGGEWLVLGGAQNGTNQVYVYLAPALADPVPFTFVDLKHLTAGPVRSASAATGFQDALYLGYLSANPGPALIALLTPPPPAGLQAAAGTDVVNLRADAMPGIAASPMIDVLAEFGGRLYVANGGGIVRSATAGVRPQPYTAAPADWSTSTPSAAPYAAKASVTTAKLDGVEPADRAFPALATFGGHLFAARNTTAGPQLWRCDPGASGACDPADWSLVAPNAPGDAALSQLGGSGNARVTLLAATARYLYVGFDDAAGVQLFRTSNPAAALASDFAGTGGCAAGASGCAPLAGAGLGDAANTRIFSARALDAAGGASLFLVAGNGTRPARLYRIPE